MAPAAGYRAIDHTADLAFALWAPDEAALLRQAAKALVATMTGNAAVRPDTTRTIRIEAADAEERLVRFANEVIYLATSQGFLLSDADIIVYPDKLVATVAGEENAHARLETEIKSATYHDLQVKRSEDGNLRAQLVVDV